MSTAILPLTANATTLRARGLPRASRDVTVDIARAWCLTVVVALHALMVGVSVGAAGPVLQNALESWPWLPAFTWLAQIMPLFVVLGGFSSYTQWGRMHARGVRPGEYVAQRMQRLVRPAVGAVAAVLIVLAALTVAGVPPEIVATAGFRLSQPLWFLGVYILCTAFVPVLAAAHRRAPAVTVGALASVVVAVDVVRAATGVTAVGFANLLFAWLLIQQLGFWLASGRLAGLSRRSLLGIAGGALVVLFVSAATGVYSFDMLANLNPPTFALVLLGGAQLALFEVARPALRRLESIRPVLAAVNAVNARAMTIYLWHMLVLIALAGIVLLSGMRLPQPLTPDWWLTRPLWLAAVGVGVALVVALAGRVELGRSRTVGAPGPGTAGTSGGAVRAYASAAAGAGGVLVILLSGFALAGGVLGAALLVASVSLSRPRAEAGVEAR
jgi:peptidoglycan/LPS O-acetylase OafA/YrhL